MITLTIQAVTNGYIVQRVKSRDMWDSCGKGYPEPFVYRNLDDLKEDLNTLFEITIFVKDLNAHQQTSRAN